MPSYPHPEKCDSITFHAKDVVRQEKIKGFKTVCIKDGLEQQEEFFKLLDKFLHDHHWPPGNPQTELFQKRKPKKKKQPEWVYNKEMMSIQRVKKRE